MSADLAPDLRRLADIVTSRLLSYPDEQLMAELPTIRAGVEQLPTNISRPINKYFEAVEGLTLLELQAKYVATFDLKRRCCLYLSYYLNGDTRRRGMALLRFKETYLQQGFTVDDGELPDFLPLLLEFSAHGGDAAKATGALIDEHREGLEVLRSALAKVAAPQQYVIDAVLATLPTLTSAQKAAARLLVAHGPPTESVGLEPFMLTDISTGARL